MCVFWGYPEKWNWTSGRDKTPEIKYLWSSSNREPRHLPSPCTQSHNLPKPSHIGKFPTFAHFGQHKPTTTPRGKRPFGLFSRLGIRRGIPFWTGKHPCTPRHWAEKELQNQPHYRCGLDTNDADGWWGGKGHFPVPLASLQHGELMKLEYLSGIACSVWLSQGQAFPSSAPAGREQLPSQPLHACSNHINHKACFYLVKPLSSEVFRLVW